MRYILPDDTSYPSRISEVVTNPPGIFIEGDITDKDNLALAIVGTRDASNWGKEIAYKFSYFLAEKGITIISGLARGIDSIAHQGALDAKGRTIAVLGSGVDVVYPRENKKLAEVIAKRGALISQFPPGTLPLAKNFLTRNGIIAALSIAVLVVEGRRRSGTLSTATHAANLGREVFAIPGIKDSPQSEVTDYLIENGAHIANTPDDVLQYLEVIV
jgi:DNA processing protein